MRHEAGGPDHPNARVMAQRLQAALTERGVAALDLSPERTEAFASDFTSVALVLLREGRGQQALPLTEAALELSIDLDPLDPRMARTQTLYGTALVQTGAVADGEAIIEAARGSLAPEDAARL